MPSNLRPPLPLRHANPFLKNLTTANLPPVKYQILSCHGAEILVGRLKIEVPVNPLAFINPRHGAAHTQQESGHAFVLRRFDTNAISVTTMFRAAFPTSNEADERVEIGWVKDNHDLAGNNGSSREPHITRLAGTWVSPELAMELAEAYNLVELIHSMVVAKPDPKGNYRRSHKSANANNTPQAAATTTTTTTTTTLNTTSSYVVNGTPAKPSSVASPKPPSKTLPTPSPTSGPTAKRRKEESPAPSSIPVPSTPTGSKTPGGVRRSARAKSPAPARGPIPLTGLKPRSRSSVPPPSPKKREAELPKAALSPIKGEEDVSLDGVAGKDLYEEDIQEQKQLIADLKKKREVAAAAASTPHKSTRAREEEMEEVDQEEEEEEEEEVEEDEGPSKLKRARVDEDEPLKFEFKEPESEERQIATNRRVGGRFEMEPRTKSIAWGLAAFAVGMGAVSFLPNFL
ncbi:hypothetical protein D9611_001882 [Ephemerocybe angulata]|uniref:HTH APSES-type domain-containing protein n=1 Tax=Ephemerocybe angulata TaxID=980116 RepID=A0A8H5CIJ2_9AGAR|nr:hypothetical protein D9611_001882 [Tulosesus angulatus]